MTTIEKILHTTPAPKARKVAPVALGELPSARVELINQTLGAHRAEGRKNGAMAHYAATCNRIWGDGWPGVANKKLSECNANEKKLRAEIDVERKALSEALKARKYPAPDLPWSRTKGYATEITNKLRDPQTGALLKAKPKPQPKTWTVRAKEDCSALFKAAQDKDLTAKEKAALKAIATALAALGVDTATLVKVGA